MKSKISDGWGWRFLKLLVNGREEEFPKEVGTVLDLLQHKRIVPETVVVELNGSVLKRDSWGTALLKDGDRLEILRFVGGG